MSYTDGQAWVNGNPNQVCGQVARNVMRTLGFLVNPG